MKQSTRVATLAVLFALMPLEWALVGWSWSTMWGWFAEPVFGITITGVQAAGLFLLKSAMWPTTSGVGDKSFLQVLEAVLNSLFERLLFFAIAYLFHLGVTS